MCVKTEEEEASDHGLDTRQPGPLSRKPVRPTSHAETWPKIIKSRAYDGRPAMGLLLAEKKRPNAEIRSTDRKLLLAQSELWLPSVMMTDSRQSQKLVKLTIIMKPHRRNSNGELMSYARLWTQQATLRLWSESAKTSTYGWSPYWPISVTRSYQLRKH